MNQPSGIRRRSTTHPGNRYLRQRAIPGAISDKLPLVHVTAVGIANEIVESRQLETRRCQVFNRELLYFFVMRPAYRMKDGDAKSDQINRFPVVFIIAPEAIKRPHHVYPFDTGGAFKGLFFGKADPYVYLEDYELEPNTAAAAGQIAWAFGNLDAYLNGDIRNDILDDVPVFEAVTHSFVGIALLAKSGSNQPDKRASAIEIAVNHNLPLKGNVKLAIFPKQYLEDGSKKNTLFMESLNNENISWEIYNWQPNTPPNEFQEEIARITKAWFKQNGYL